MLYIIYYILYIIYYILYLLTNYIMQVRSIRGQNGQDRPWEHHIDPGSILGATWVDPGRPVGGPIEPRSTLEGQLGGKNDRSGSKMSPSGCKK